MTEGRAGRTGIRAVLRCVRPAALAALVLLVLGGCSWLPSWLGGTPSRTTEPSPLPEFKPTLSPRIVWRASVGSARNAFLQPAVVENAIYAAGGDGVVVRLAPDSGQAVWRSELKSRITGGVGSDGFTVAVGTARGEVIALGADGKELWRAQAAGEMQGPPLVGRGLVVVRGSDSRITAFDAASGRRRWSYQRASTPLTVRGPSGLGYAGDLIVAGFPAGRLVALSSANGVVRWDVPVSEPRGATEVERLADVMGAPLVNPQEVCAASFQGRVACFEAANGALRWARELSAADGPGGDLERVYVVDSQSHVHAYSRTAGASAWVQQKLAHRDLSAPLALRRAVLMGDYRGIVHLLSPDDGSFLARIELGGAIAAAPRAFGGGAVVQTQDGTVALISIE